MASLTIIPYIPVPAKDRYASKRSNDCGKEHQTTLSTLAVDTPQLRATAVADNASGPSTHGNDLEERAGGIFASIQTNYACSQRYLDRDSPVNRDESEDASGNSDLEINSLFKETFGDTEPTIETESGAGGPGIRDGIAGIEAGDIESETGDTEIDHYPLKRKASPGGQGNQDNPWVIPDSDTDSESDIEGRDGLARKKRKVYPRWRIEETDVETDSTEFDTPSANTADIQSKGNARDVGNGESREQAHLSSGALPAHLTLSESDDRVKAQSVARVGGNGKWGIHGIIGKEVIGGELYYCVDWEPTMVRSNELLGAQHLIREFEKNEQARLRKAGNRRKTER
ncbi:MAG: hypothetical protein M1839_005806 [Geoglossum umbratile]|nr:MAG: hypothetical protein M1839_005806 [Geoglossum umbratile]